MALVNAIIDSIWFSLMGASFSARFAFQSSRPAIACFTIASAASRSFSGATTASTAPSFSAASGFLSAPVQIHSIALSTPITRGSAHAAAEAREDAELHFGEADRRGVDITR